jgi:hypothetical protein
MSCVTDIVFVSCGMGVKDRFQNIFIDKYDRYKDPWIPQPAEDGGNKVSGALVFHLGVNYANVELLEALRNEPWPPGTVLWINPEDGDLEIKTW